MAETLLSPGVLTRENDQSQVTSGPIAVGAAIIGPTVKGPVEIPTIVTSYSDYKNKFGAAFISGGVNLEYLTSISTYNYFQQGGESLLVTRVVSGSTAAYTPATSSQITNLGGSAASFVLETLSEGVIMNNATQSGVTNKTLSGGALASGSTDNIRWTVTNVNTGSGTFNLIIRQGNDTQNQQLVVETWLNLSLDPNATNYIEYTIGNQTKNLITDGDGNLNVQVTGSYINQSRYVRVSNVPNPTPNYLLNNGTFNSAYTASLPAVGSGSEGGAFGGATGPLFGNGTTASPGLKMFGDINSVNIQGLSGSDYANAISVLSNPDEYDYEWIVLPGVNYQNASTLLSTLMANCENRGDTMAVVDMVNYGAAVSTVNTAANSFDSSYGATYWPWVQVLSQETGKLVFVPASTIMAGVYAYNDKVAETWFAPAGFNRGGLNGVIQAERKLSPADRDSLYINKVNPIATFPGQGVVAFGQKTLQSKASALDRVNVRRLLITLKDFIGQIANNLVFEQNTATTRNKFLNQVNPYLENVQQKQGLYTYKVVMDESNNTAETIDRNQLVGAIYLQPTKTAEFIILDFNITPTGVQFA